MLYQLIVCCHLLFRTRNGRDHFQTYSNEPRKNIDEVPETPPVSMREHLCNRAETQTGYGASRPEDDKKE